MLAFDSLPTREPDLTPQLTPALIGVATAAEDALARLDAILEAHPLGAALTRRLDFFEATAALALEGELVPLEDLVLHDARADIRTPSHELTRAQRYLENRRRIRAAEPGWAQTVEGRDVLLGRLVAPPDPSQAAPQSDDARLAAEFAALDALLKRSSNTLAAVAKAGRFEAPAYHAAQGSETEAAADPWMAAVSANQNLPPLLATASCVAAFRASAPGRNEPNLALLLAADLLRQRGKTRHHLACLAIGLRVLPRERRQAKEFTRRIYALLEAVGAAASRAQHELDRLALLRQTLGRRAGKRRATSKMGKLIDVVLAHPMVTSAMIADTLAITPRAAQTMVQELGLREMTGRLRYRAWGVV